MIAEYDSWIGKKEVYADQLTEINSTRLHYSLNLSGKPPSYGEPVFPLALLMLGEPSVPPDEVGLDGHPARGDFMPPVPLKRRMFAGGEYEFFQPLKVGDQVSVSWEITDITQNSGNSGELVFVNVLREFWVKETLCARENRTIVYTDSDPKSRPQTAPEKIGEWNEEMRTNSLQLFRYSALTFNGHRVHYDQPYATQVEGYPGLVVHGPLLATWLSLFAAKKSGLQLKKFKFSGKRPVFDLHHFTLSGENCGNNAAKLSVLDHQLQLAVTAEAEFFPS
jgi:3-methylfumaryl-CoA hydratase